MTEKQFMQQLGKRIKQLRLDAGLTQEDMEDFDINVKQYQRIERGIVNPRSYTLTKLCRAFGCSSEAILGF